jgi:hypothetical protein
VWNSSFVCLLSIILQTLIVREQGCSELFLVLAKCYGVPQTPIDVSEWTG